MAERVRLQSVIDPEQNTLIMQEINVKERDRQHILYDMINTPQRCTHRSGMSNDASPVVDQAHDDEHNDKDDLDQREPVF